MGSTGPLGVTGPRQLGLPAGWRTAPLHDRAQAQTFHSTCETDVGGPIKGERRGEHGIDLSELAHGAFKGRFVLKINWKPTMYVRIIHRISVHRDPVCIPPLICLLLFAFFFQKVKEGIVNKGRLNHGHYGDKVTLSLTVQTLWYCHRDHIKTFSEERLGGSVS